MESVVVDVGSSTLRVGHGGNDVPSIRVPLLPPSYAPPFSFSFFIIK
jgi:actin-related protein